MTKQIIILRYGHRLIRDQRVTTHCILVARALGADKIILTGDEDKELIEKTVKFCTEWGGKFSMEFQTNWKQVLQEHKRKGFKIIHTTMYGRPIQKEIKQIRKAKKIMIIIGSQKVPIEAYELADYNIAITSQPHSEIAALAITLHEIFKGKELDKKFTNALKKIIPSKKYKNVIKTNKKDSQ